jgi:hypothetical protein
MCTARNEVWWQPAGMKAEESKLSLEDVSPSVLLREQRGRDVRRV